MYLDCENNGVICNRAGWDENQPRLQGTSPTPALGEEVGMRTRRILRQNTDCKHRVRIQQ